MQQAASRRRLSARCSELPCAQGGLVDRGCGTHGRLSATQRRMGAGDDPDEWAPMGLLPGREPGAPPRGVEQLCAWAQEHERRSNGGAARQWRCGSVGAQSGGETSTMCRPAAAAPRHRRHGHHHRRDRAQRDHTGSGPIAMGMCRAKSAPAERRRTLSSAPAPEALQG